MAWEQVSQEHVGGNLFTSVWRLPVPGGWIYCIWSSGFACTFVPALAHAAAPVPRPTEAPPAPVEVVAETPAPKPTALPPKPLLNRTR